MIIQASSRLMFVFDLDDTLYSERNYLVSAFREIAAYLAGVSRRTGITEQNVFEIMMRTYEARGNAFRAALESIGLHGSPILALLNKYRNHIPTISLYEDAEDFLKKLSKCGIPCALVTDGRSITQRNKLRALGIENLFTDIIVSEEFGSEKPKLKNFSYFNRKYPEREFVYVGDNTDKDFEGPLRLGWKTICRRCSGYNIHAQNIKNLAPETVVIDSFYQVELISDEEILLGLKTAK